MHQKKKGNKTGVMFAVRMNVYTPPLPSFTIPKTIYTVNNSTKGVMGIDAPEH